MDFSSCKGDWLNLAEFVQNVPLMKYTKYALCATLFYLLFHTRYCQPDCHQPPQVHAAGPADSTIDTNTELHELDLVR